MCEVNVVKDDEELRIYFCLMLAGSVCPLPHPAHVWLTGLLFFCKTSSCANIFDINNIELC